MLKPLLIVSALALAGCAATPDAAAPAPKAAIPTAVAPGSGQPNARPLDPLTVGFTSVMKDGTEYFCQKYAPTGSKMKNQERCFTRQELLDAEAEAKRNIRNMETVRPPE